MQVCYQKNCESNECCDCTIIDQCDYIKRDFSGKFGILRHGSRYVVHKSPNREPKIRHNMASSPSSRLLLPLVTDPCLICLNGTRKDDDVYDTYEINGFHCSDAITAAVEIESGSESCSFFTEAFGPSCCDHPSTTDTMLSPTLVRVLCVYCP